MEARLGHVYSMDSQGNASWTRRGTPAHTPGPGLAAGGHADQRGGLTTVYRVYAHVLGQTQAKGARAPLLTTDGYHAGSTPPATAPPLQRNRYR